MTTFKLTYFNLRGRGEAARVLFKLAGVEFEDFRIEFNDWPEYKPKTPFGCVPILEVDGKQLTQSKAINRYLARRFGYYPDKPLMSADVDAIMDMMDDLRQANVTAILFGSAEDKEKAQAEFKELATKVLGGLEKKLCENDDGDGFFVGLEMTLADILLYIEFDFITGLLGSKDIFQNFPKLSALRRRVGQNERISDWVAKRPPTPL